MYSFETNTPNGYKIKSLIFRFKHNVFGAIPKVYLSFSPNYPTISLSMLYFQSIHRYVYQLIFSFDFLKQMLENEPKEKKIGAND